MFDWPRKINLCLSLSEDWSRIQFFCLSPKTSMLATDFLPSLLCHIHFAHMKTRKEKTWLLQVIWAWTKKVFQGAFIIKVCNEESECCFISSQSISYLQIIRRLPFLVHKKKDKKKCYKAVQTSRNAQTVQTKYKQTVQTKGANWTK